MEDRGSFPGCWAPVDLGHFVDVTRRSSRGIASRFLTMVLVIGLSGACVKSVIEEGVPRSEVVP